MEIEDFFDLRIATIGPDETPPAGVHLVRIADPSPRTAATFVRDGWFYKPCWVTYVMEVPSSLEEYIERHFSSRARNKPRKLLREVPRRYALEIDEDGRRFDDFRKLYARTVVARERGKDRLAEHHDAWEPGWVGFHLLHDGALVAGVLVQSEPGHHSVGYGAFDPAHRQGLDLEHFLILQVLQRSIDRGHEALSLGIDTNRYGHHLPLGLSAYKLRIGFTPLPYEPGGRELLKIADFGPFRDGLFFYAYGKGGLLGHLFTRGPADLRPFEHQAAPPVQAHPIA